MPCCHTYTKGWCHAQGGRIQDPFFSSIAPCGGGGGKRPDPTSRKDRRLNLEPLEHREMLSVTPLVALGGARVEMTAGAQNLVVDLAPRFKDANYSFHDLTYQLDRGDSDLSVFSGARVVSGMEWLLVSAAADASGTGQVAVQATDPAGNTAVATITIDVTPASDSTSTATSGRGRVAQFDTNDPPSISSYNSSVNVGDTYTINLDEGNNSVQEWVVDWGDGTGPTTEQGYCSSATHVYNVAAAQYTVSATATDDQNNTVPTNTVSVSVTNLPPVVTLSDSSVDEGASYTPSITATDPQNESFTNFSVYWGDGQSSSGPWSQWPPQHQYSGDSGTYYASISVEDSGGSWGSSNSAAVTINNVAPTVTASGAASVNEGDQYSLQISASDPGNDLAGWRIDWGDNTSDYSYVSGWDPMPTSYTHVYNGVSGTQSIYVSVMDACYATGSYQTSVSVTNLPPTVNIHQYQPTAPTINEGGTFWISPSVTDPGNDLSSWSVNWGDGTTTDSSSLPSFSVPSSLTHTYGSAGNYSVVMTATDVCGATGTDSLPLVVNNVAPTATITAGASSVDEGTSLGVSLSSSDPGNDASSWVVAWGDGQTSSGSVTPWSPLPTSLDHTYGGTWGNETIEYTVTDAGGLTGSASTSVTVNHLAPVVTLSGDYNTNIDEGSTYTVTLSATSPGGETIGSSEINWGDGTTSWYTTAPTGPQTHQYFMPSGGCGSSGWSEYTITASAQDESGVWGSDTGTSNSISIEVNNVAPTVTLTGDTSVAEGSTCSVSLAATDPGNDIESWSLAWGDGTTLTGGMAPPSSAFTHQYSSPSNYTVTATVLDQSGATGTATLGVSYTNVTPTVNVEVIDGNGTPIAPVVNVGDPMGLSIVACDPGGDAAGGTYTVNWGNMNPPPGWWGGPNSSGTLCETSGNYAGANTGYSFTSPGSYTITGTVTDTNGGCTDFSLPITVNRLPLGVSISGAPSAAVKEGSTTNLSAGAVGIWPNSTFSYSWSVTQDGQAYAVPSNVPTDQTNFAFTPDDDGAWVVTVTATDQYGNWDTCSTSSVAVQSVAPTFTAQTADRSINVGQNLSLSWNFTDPCFDPADAYTCSIDWGSGTWGASLPVTSTQLGSTGVPTKGHFSGSHPFNVGGDYHVRVKVADGDGDQTIQTFTVHVKAPLGGDPIDPVGPPWDPNQPQPDPTGSDSSSFSEYDSYSYSYLYGGGPSGPPLPGNPGGRNTYGAWGPSSNFIPTCPYCYDPAVNPHPVVGINLTFPPTDAVPDYLEFDVDFDPGGADLSSTVYYSTAGVQPGDTVQLTQEVDAVQLDSGRYDYTMTITPYTGSTAGTPQTFGDHIEIVNRARSPFGSRFWPGDIDQLTDLGAGDGVSLIRGNNTAAWFAVDTTTEDQITYTPPAGTFGTLSYDRSAHTYTLTDPQGNKEVFNSQGQMTDRLDPQGDATHYGYNSAGNPSTVTDPLGHTTTYGYDSEGRCTSIEDFAQRTTRMTFVDDTSTPVTEHLLTTLTEPNPDGSGSGGPLWQFGYDMPTGLMTSLENPEGAVTQYQYQGDRLVKRTYPDGTFESMAPPELASVVDPAQYGDSQHLAPMMLTGDVGGSKTDQLGSTTTYTTDAFGNLLSETNPLGQTTTYERDANGLVTAMWTPGESAPTLYTYDDSAHTSTVGDLTRVDYPDGTYETWQYDSTWNVPTRHVDRAGWETDYTIDAATGLTLDVIQKGQNGHADVVTHYTYTGEVDPQTGLPLYPDYVGLPKNLVVTEIDPKQIETVYQYGTTAYLSGTTTPDGSFGKVITVTTAYGCSDASSVQYGYDEYGNQTSVTQDVTATAQRTTAFAYDALDRVTSMTEPSGATTQYQYNSLGDCTAVIDAAGHETDYGYDSLGKLLLSETDPSVLVGQTGPGTGTPERPTTIYGYDADGRLASITAPDGGVTHYTRDALGRALEIDEPAPDANGDAGASSDSPTVEFAYDDAGNVQTVTDPLGNVTTYAYDAMHRLTTVTGPDPGTGAPITEYGYDGDGELTSVTLTSSAASPTPRVTTYQYDEFGRKIEVDSPDPSGGSAAVTTFIYDADGNLVEEINPENYATWYTYDDLGDLATASNPGFRSQDPTTLPVTTYTYYLDGELSTATDPLGHQTTYLYDGDGRLGTVTQPDPGGSQVVPSTTYGYDLVGNLTSETDALCETTTYTYNALGWRTSQTDPDGHVTMYGYDIMGNMTSQRDASSLHNVTHWAYDALGRVTSETDPGGGTTSYLYDLAGNLTQKTDADNRATAYDYDSLNRETAERWLDGSGNTIRTESYAYDSAGDLHSASDPDSAYTYSYGSAGQVNSVTASIAGLTPSVTLNATYDSGGERTLLRAVIGGVHDISIDYGYGADGQVSYITPSASGGGDGYDYVPYMDIFFYYDSAGQLQTIDRNSEATSSYTFDADGRLTALDYDHGSTTLEHYAYTYDGAGRVASMADTYDGSVIYSYDSAGQLTGADYSQNPPPDESYTYDGNGNRLTAGGSSYTTGAGNRTTSDGTYTYTYDAEGNRTARFVDGNSNGTLDSGDTDVTEYTWDYRNRLTSATHYAAYGDTTFTQKVAYTYDVFDHMIGRVVTDSSGVTQTRFIYDGDRVLLQFDGPGGGTGSASDLTGADLSHRYLWGPAVDQLLCDEQLSPLPPGEGQGEGSAGYDLTTAGTVVWTLGDAQNTIRDLATYDSGTGTTIVNHRVYNAYGGLVSETSGALVDCVFGFNGQFLDNATGLQNSGPDWYDPAVGQWANGDSASIGDNPYGYEGNDPVGSGSLAAAPCDGPPTIGLTPGGNPPTVVPPGWSNPWRPGGGAMSVGGGMGDTVNLEWVLTFGSTPSPGQWGRNVYPDGKFHVEKDGSVVLTDPYNPEDDTDLPYDHVQGQKVYMYDAPGRVMNLPVFAPPAHFVFEVWAKSAEGITTRWFYVDATARKFYEIDPPTFGVGPAPKKPRPSPWPQGVNHPPWYQDCPKNQ